MITDPFSSFIPLFSYSVCIRPEAGICCVQYYLCGDTSSWSIDAVIASKAEVDNQCTSDYIGIEGAMNACQLNPGASLHSRMCGPILRNETR